MLDLGTLYHGTKTDSNKWKNPGWRGQICMHEKQMKSLHKDSVGVTSCSVLLNFTVKHIFLREGTYPIVSWWVWIAESTAAPELPLNTTPSQLRWIDQWYVYKPDRKTASKPGWWWMPNYEQVTVCHVIHAIASHCNFKWTVFYFEILNNRKCQVRLCVLRFEV